MKLEVYKDINRYLEDTLEVLAENEVQNNIIIGNCLKAARGQDISNWFLAVVKDEAGGVRLSAMMTPPYHLCLYETGNEPDDAVLAYFAGELTATGITVPGVITEKSLAARFSDAFLPEAVKKLEMSMRVYRLDEVCDIPVSAGKLRRAVEEDIHYLPYWRVYFSIDCGFGAMEVKDAADKVLVSIKEENLYVWEDGCPVSQASVERTTMNCAVVTYVYTPPHFRGKGYASSCVAGLSRLLLEKGFQCCSLFTDINNPVSNGIYMKIGYKPVCDYSSISFKVPQKEAG